MSAFKPSGKDPLQVDTATLFLDYPENIQLYVISFNTNIGSWAVSGEYGYRPNQPLQILQSDVLFATLGPAFPAQDIPIGLNTVTDPALLSALPGALAQPLQHLEQGLLNKLPGGAIFTPPGEDKPLPDFLRRYPTQPTNDGHDYPGHE